jgi:nicotinamidase-related amidase
MAASTEVQGEGGMNIDDVQILFADLQPPIIARSKTNPFRSIRASAAVLAEIASILRIPMLFSVVPDGGSAPELIAELTAHANAANTLPRTSANPMLDPATVAALARNERETILLAGFATEVVVVHAALGAIEQGYEVFVPVDACGGMSERTEAAAFRQIEAAGGTTSSVVWLATALTPEFGRPPGSEVFETLQQLRLA